MEDTSSGSGAKRPPRAARRKSVTAGQPSDKAEQHRFHGFVSVQSRGTVALPPAIRKRYGLDLPGSQVEITERSDGVLELRPNIAVPASQAWFWTESWQEGERRADSDIAAGRTTTYDNVDDFMDSLDVDE